MLEQANAGVISAFQDTDAGEGVEFKESYGASGDQARAVIAGQDADEVHLSLEPDVQKLVDEGLVADDWKDNDTKGICTTSVVVMVVRTGNPKNIQTWDDLIKPGVGIVTPNPASSGSAKWNLLAAYGSVLGEGGTEDDAAAYLKTSSPTSRRCRTAVATRPPRSPAAPATCCCPTRTRRSSPSRAGPTSTTSSRTAPCSSRTRARSSTAPRTRPRTSWTSRSPRTGQKLYAETGYRPLVDVGDVEVQGANDPADPFPDPETLLTIDDDFGGWADANTKYFDEEDGIITEIQAEAGE